MPGFQESLPVFFQRRSFVFRQCEIAEPLPDIVHGLGRGMKHILGIEAVVPQLVHHYLVAREIHASFREGLTQGLCRHQENAFAYLVAVGPVLEMAYRAHRKNEFLWLDTGYSSGGEPGHN